MNKSKSLADILLSMVNELGFKSVEVEFIPATGKRHGIYLNIRKGYSQWFITGSSESMVCDKLVKFLSEQNNL